MPPGGWWSERSERDICPRRCKGEIPSAAKGEGRGSTLAFEAVRVYNTYNLYNQLYNLYNECTRCLCLCLDLLLFGSEQHGTGRDKGVAAGGPPPGGPVRSIGKNSRSPRVTSFYTGRTLWFFPESNEPARPAAAGPKRVRGGRAMAGCVAS